MANPVNLTRLLELGARDELVRKAGLLPVVIPEDILQNQVLNPNYHPPDLPKYLLIIVWLCIFVPLVGVILRFLARFGNESRIGLDDWFAVIAWIASAAFGSTTIAAVKMGAMGRHIWLAADSELNAGYMIGYYHQITYGIASFFLHITIMFFYLRIISPELLARKILYLFFAIHIIYLPIFIAVSAFMCSPVRSGWDLTYRLMLGEQNKCMDPIMLVTGLTITGIITDCLLFLLPVGVVWRLKLEVRQKLLVSGLFLLGGLACIASGVRLHYFIQLTNSFDRTYYAMPVNALGHIEIALGLLTACLPMMRQAIILLPRTTFHDKVLSRLNFWRRRRKRRNSIRVQKIDSRSTKITTATRATADIIEGGTMLQDLESGGVPAAPPPSLASMAGTPGRELSRITSRASSGSNIRNSRQERIVRDINNNIRDAELTAQSSTAGDDGDVLMEIDDMWIMMEDGPVRVPIRFELPARTRSREPS